MTGRNFSLTKPISDFIDSQVETGRHQNASEVVREALRRYEHQVKIQDAELEAIHTIIREGREAIARGEYTTIDGPDDEARLIEELLGYRPSWMAGPGA